MKRFFQALGLGGLVTLAACSQGDDTTAPAPPASADDGIELRPVTVTGRDAVVLDQIADAAVAFAHARRKELGISARDELSVMNVRRGAGGLTHVRLGQRLDGVRVFGGDVVAHAEGDAIVALSGRLATHLDRFDVKPVLAAADATQLAKEAFAGAAADTFVYERASTELVILPSEAGGANLAYRVELFTELQNGTPPGLWNTFIDAKSGAVLLRFNAIHTLAQASGPGGNPKVPRTWTSALDVEASGSGYVENTSRLQTVTLGNKTSGAGTTISGSLGNIGDAAANDAHGFAEVTLNMLSEWMGYNSIDEQGFKILSRVHYGTRYENAYWDGTQMTYGDGANTFYPLSGALDVVAHEIDHGFTSNHSNLTYSGQSGGMNEAFSDIAGTVAEFYFEGNGANFDLGSDIFKQTGALRYMCDPTKDGASIDDASKYRSGIDVHYSSGVYNKSFCLAAKRLSSGSPTGAATADGVRRAGKAYFEANANYWTASATFVTGCVGVLDAAKALGYAAADVTSLQQSFADVGVTCAPTGGGGGGSTGDWAASATPNLALVDRGTACSSVTVTAAGNAADAKLDLVGTHTYRSVLRATLAHDGVTAAAFATRTFPSSAGTFTLASKAITGFSGSATGTWTLCITDTDAYGDSGTLSSFGVHR